MSDSAAIRDTLAAYALALDANDIEGCLTLFADDAEFEVYGTVFTGRDGIGEMFRAAPNGLHLTGASRVDVGQDNTASARSQVLFVQCRYAALTHQMRLALYDDDLVCRDGTWLFRRRRCRFITGTGLSDRPEEMSP
ncbi:hypothetical protein A5634_08485 [Mycobacterium asiaticum]|uniref:SnoaL-like domain-containing protein n=1 Tax=Mycobacterium asiaticum TaxID=1790 RepID=A0A1A3NM98_MYCAS|nr:nuclear transport factor 2 family protein [Mycobacterium asiaticum]OBK22189.1 hypothetical protein A5634_08485 [Mycobacterium asiaticum]